MNIIFILFFITSSITTVWTAVVHPSQIYPYFVPQSRPQRYPLDDTSTYTINGIDIGDKAGVALSDAGDVNGDGFDDFLISARFASPFGVATAGEVYLLYGGPTLTFPFELSTLNGSNGVQFNGVNSTDMAGHSVAGVGDVNNDGFDDILIGSPRAPAGVKFGHTYLIYGGPSVSHPFNLSSVNGTNGVTFVGESANDQSGIVISAAGDVNNDTYSDFLIAANFITPIPKVYLIFGSANPLPHPFNFSLLNATFGVIFDGISGSDSFGSALSQAGDFNNDGVDDILIAARTSAVGGSVYLIFGSSSLPPVFNVSILDGFNGIHFDGASASDFTGTSLSDVGDFNNDGIDDILIGAPAADPNGAESGLVYLVYGNSLIFPNPFNLSLLNSSTGIKFNGITVNDQAGINIAGVGDVTNDGVDDILIGAPTDTVDGNSGAGQVYLVYGGANFSNVFELSSLNGENGVVFYGTQINMYAGDHITKIGDVNGDGFNDFLISLIEANSATGQSHLIFGSPPSGTYLYNNSISYCPNGTYYPFHAYSFSYPCGDCPFSTFAPNPGHSECKSCPQYSTCLKSFDFECIYGTYRFNSSSCIPCPSGSICYSNEIQIADSSNSQSKATSPTIEESPLYSYFIVAVILVCISVAANGFLFFKLYNGSTSSSSSSSGTADVDDSPQ